MAFTLAGSAFAGSGPGAPPAETALARLEAALARDTALAPELKQALIDVAAALRAERSGAAAPSGAPAAAAAGAASAPRETAAAQPPKRFEPTGDFRYRHETTAFAAASTDTRQRERVRLRAGLLWRPSPELTIAGQLQTGDPLDPKSPHATLGNAFRSLPVNLSLASATWQPARARGLRLLGGKFASPLVTNPVYAEMVWDADIRPEGGLASWSRGGKGRLGASAGYYVVQERAAGDDPGAFVAQGFARATRGRAEATLSLGYYAFDRTTSRNPGTLLPLAPGNATLDSDGDGRPDRFASEFRLWHPVAALRLDAAGRPLVLAGEYAHNAGGLEGRNEAFALGASWGSTRKPGDWQAYYQYLDVQPEAVFALVTQDDLTRATDYRGHVLGARLQLLEKAGVNAWALGAKPSQGEGGFDWRFRLDLNVSY